MAEVTVETITVRFFAAACAATGFESEQLTVPSGATVSELVDMLAFRSQELAHVLGRCSFLCDGIAVRDRTRPLHAGNTIDVLPPFAGG